MIQAIARSSSAEILRFPTLFERSKSIDASKLNLTSYYNTYLLPELQEGEEGIAKRSIDSDRYALRHWERHTQSPAVCEIGSKHLDMLIAGATAENLSRGTINLIWREVRAMIGAAVVDGLLEQVPTLARRRRGRQIKSRLLKEAPKVQREIVTEDELHRLWDACVYATYPANQQFPAVEMWRTALVLFWTYGARTIDFLQDLRWDHVRFSDRLLQFTARKTSKLQGLPLTDTAIYYVKRIRGHSDRVFPGFNSPGCFLQKSNTWKKGFRATWRAEICANAGLSMPITPKHFRERVLTKYNAMHPGLGSWILGHYMPGVSAQNYDLPTDQIRDLICSAAVPRCFQSRR